MTNMTTTGLIKHIIAVVDNIVKNIINIDYKVIMEVFIEVYFKVIARRNTIFIRN
jgi:hypothetical protein